MAVPLNGLKRGALWLAVFTCGFVNLALEVVFPRVIATIYGSTLAGWALGITTVLGGLAIGYSVAGIVDASRAGRWLQVTMLLGATWTVFGERLCWASARASGSYGLGAIAWTTAVALGPPSVLFGMCPVLSLSGLVRTGDPGTSTTARVFALSTIGSILGGLTGAFIGLRYFGISTTVHILAGLIVLIVGLLSPRMAVLGGILVLSSALAGFRTPVRAGMELVETRQSPWQTVMVLRQGEEKIMAFGPETQTLWNESRRKGGPYLAVLVELARLRSARRVLIVGGAGNALGHMLEDAGIEVVVMELDPVVAELSARHFGAIRGQVWIGDGRMGLRRQAGQPFDMIVLDAFSGPGVIPGHLLTVEALQELRRQLVPGGLLAVNLHGAPAGTLSAGTALICDTMRVAFEFVRMWPVEECHERSELWQNIWAFGTSDESFSSGVPAPAGSMPPATDDLNRLDFVLPELSMRAFESLQLERVWDFDK